MSKKTATKTAAAANVEKSAPSTVLPLPAAVDGSRTTDYGVVIPAAAALAADRMIAANQTAADAVAAAQKTQKDVLAEVRELIRTANPGISDSKESRAIRELLVVEGGMKLGTFKGTLSEVRATEAREAAAEDGTDPADADTASRETVRGPLSDADRFARWLNSTGWDRPTAVALLKGLTFDPADVKDNGRGGWTA